MTNFVIQGYANLENVNANNMDLFYATMSAQLSTFFPIGVLSQGSICYGIGNISNRYGQASTTNVFTFVSGAIRFLDQVTNLTTDVSIKPCYANYTATSPVTITCPISVTQYYAVAVLSFNTPIDPFTTSTSVIISPTAMTLAQIAAEPVPSLYNPLFAITTTDGTHYTIGLDAFCAFNYGYILGGQFPDISDIAGLVAIIGSGGLNILGPVVGAQSGEFFNNGLGPFIVFSRASSTLPNTYNLGLYSEVPSTSIAGETHVAILQANGGSFDSVLAAGYNTKRWHMLNVAPGDLSPATYPNAVAMLGDVVLGFPSESFQVGPGASYTLTINGSNVFPNVSSGLGISGRLQGVTIPTGMSTLNVDLVTLGIISGSRVDLSFGPATTGLTGGILVTCEFNGTNLIFQTSSSLGSPTAADIDFSIEI